VSQAIVSDSKSHLRSIRQSYRFSKSQLIFSRKMPHESPVALHRAEMHGIAEIEPQSRLWHNVGLLLKNFIQSH
jgi:hypothetical protein